MFSRSRDQTLVESFDWTTANTPSEAIVDVVSNVADVAPTDLPPLFESLDPDALDTLLTRTSDSRVPNETRIEFPFYQHRVVVKGNGRGYVYDELQPVSGAFGPLWTDTDSSGD